MLLLRSCFWPYLPVIISARSSRRLWLLPCAPPSAWGGPYAIGVACGAFKEGSIIISLHMSDVLAPWGPQMIEAM